MTPLNFIDPRAIVPASSKVWHFAVVMDGVVLGEDVSIGSNAEIGRGSQIGDRTRISRGVFLPYNSLVGSDVFIGPNTTFTDDNYPRVLGAGEHYTAEPPIIEDHVSIGAGAVILPGVVIGRYALIGAGSVVTHHVGAHTKVYGNPARQKGASNTSPLFHVKHHPAGGARG